jgi:SAM-dependent methyltransferase
MRYNNPVAGEQKAALVINSFNDAEFLPEALDSALAQSVPFAEIVVVDDGSVNDPGPIVAQYPGVQLIRQANAGLAAARNTGLAAITSPKVSFLDADDRLMPNALKHGLAAYADSPGAGFVYGAHVRTDRSGTRLGRRRYSPIGPDAFTTLLRGNAVAMHATALYQREALEAAGGFDTSLRCCEDYDLYLRLARQRSIASHPHIVAEYRQHDANMSRDWRKMGRTVLEVHDRQRKSAAIKVEWAQAFAEGRRSWSDYYAWEAMKAAREAWLQNRRLRSLAHDLLAAIILSPPTVARSSLNLAKRFLSGRRPLHRVHLGDLSRIDPVSRDFGFDRGTPIDRYYIEHFLAENAGRIRGRALEIGDAAYCKQFGRGVWHQDILHVHTGNPAATLVGDLTQPGVLPNDAFDCMVLTQTLHLIFDLPKAIVAIHQGLRTGGTALVTVPGISPIDRGEWGASWFWSLTTASAECLFESVFGPGCVEVEAYGNVYAATCFLQGLALEEVDRAKLDAFDAAFPVIITVRATKADAI